MGSVFFIFFDETLTFQVLIKNYFNKHAKSFCTNLPISMISDIEVINKIRIIAYHILYLYHLYTFISISLIVQVNIRYHDLRYRDLVISNLFQICNLDIHSFQIGYLHGFKLEIFFHNNCFCSSSYPISSFSDIGCSTY